mgnify:CR=1 FL=1|jgi:hypothetical protein
MKRSEDIRRMAYECAIRDIERNICNAASKHQFIYEYLLTDSNLGMTIIKHFQNLGFKIKLQKNNCTDKILFESIMKIIISW